jgi:hypothetical protein
MFDGKVVTYRDQNEQELQRENRGPKDYQKLLVEELLIFHEQKEQQLYYILLDVNHEEQGGDHRCVREWVVPLVGPLLELLVDPKHVHADQG